MTAAGGGDFVLTGLMGSAAVAAGLAEKEGRVDLLFCEKLDDAPEIIKQIFSAVLGDIFHGMNQAKVPVRHEYKKGYYIAFMKAFLAWDPDRLKEVTNKLKENGFSDEDIEMLMYYHPSFFAKVRVLYCEHIDIPNVTMPT